MAPGIVSIPRSICEICSQITRLQFELAIELTLSHWEENCTFAYALRVVIAQQCIIVHQSLNTKGK